MLNFIYYPVSWILWFWHMVFGFVFGASSGITWALAVVFLVFTLRALLYKPFVHQVRSMRKMQEFAPEIQKLKKKYGNDKQKMAAEMQRLQSEHGVSPLGGCLPVLVQVPVFIGLFHVLREFRPGKTENYVFDAAGVQSFNEAHIFGAKLGAVVGPEFLPNFPLFHVAGYPPLAAYDTTVGQMLVVMVPLAIMAGIFTHITARHSVARQTPAQIENPQTAIMNRLTLYLFPIGVVVFAPMLPLAILFYWVSNNLWTLGQQRVVYSKIDREEAEKATKKTETQRSLAPKVGQKPDQARKQKKPGAKPIAPSRGKAGGAASSNGAAGTGKARGATGASKPAAASTNGAAAGSDDRPVTDATPTNGVVEDPTSSPAASEPAPSDPTAEVGSDADSAGRSGAAKRRRKRR
ncbi:membrane protein insertase YidC [Pseudonocardia acaciae]|uniref:membrane protein insertase YidC n=1 Tax=Pseudonocardia acaciae TaxID=551276 RepID=UPI000685D670|nr:membrane protein insertase YidC [Pseudonocardia acaciae]